MISHQQQNIQYTDYVPLLTSEQILKTAQYRQNLADENFAAIKDAVDSYSKLRSYMINDVSRNYFDQELTKLTNTIRQSAGLDFSNKGNLANVLAVGRPFENDKIIIGNLKVGKEQERRQLELNNVSADQRNEDNDLVYMNDIYDYMKSNDLNATVQMNKEYTPYVDVSEEILKIEKDVAAEMSTIVPQKLPNGYIDFTEVEAKRKERVLERIKNLSPEHQRQIEIHARAKMYRMGPENTYNYLKKYYTTQMETVETELMKDAKTKAATLKLYEKDKSAKNKAALDNINFNISERQKMLTALREQVEMSPDQFNLDTYVELFQDHFLDQIAEKASYEKMKHNVQTDHFVMKKLELNNSMALAREQNRLQVNALVRKEILTDFTPTTNLSWIPGTTGKSMLAVLRGLGDQDINEALKTRGADQIKKISQRLEEILTSSNISEAGKPVLQNYKKILDTIYDNFDAAGSEVESLTGGENVMMPNYVDLGTTYAEDNQLYASDRMGVMTDLPNMKIEDILVGGQFSILRPRQGGETWQAIQSAGKKSLSMADILADRLKNEPR